MLVVYKPIYFTANVAVIKLKLHIVVSQLTLTLRTCLTLQRGDNFQWRPPIPTRISKIWLLSLIFLATH